MDNSLIESLPFIQFSFIQIVIALLLSLIISLLLGWALTINSQISRLAESTFRQLICTVTIVPTLFLTLINVLPRNEISELAITVFVCSLIFTILYAILGFRQAKQENQWYLVIPNVSLGMRIGLLLSWPLLAIEAVRNDRGVGFLIWDAINAGEAEKVASGILTVTILAFFLDQIIDLSSLLFSQVLKSNHNS
jgi:ABC-type nitrate/sulfonate/bicarbonate transport system permease component